MSSVLETDAEVCRGIQQLQSLLMEERRRAPRRPFPVVRRIAQAVGQKMPDEAAFFPVQCRDISTHGFSFLVKARPQFKSLVLALEASPKPIFIAAEVRHCTEVLVHPSGRVEVLYDRRAQAGCEHRDTVKAGFWVLVGCEFTRRIPAPEDEGPAPG